MSIGGEGTIVPKSIRILRKQNRLLMEICHFTQDLNPLWETKASLFNIEKLHRPLVEKLDHLEDQEQKFKQVCHYFFNTLGFEIMNASSGNLQQSLLPYVLNSRRGPAPLLMLLFCGLLEDCKIKSHVGSYRGKLLLKVQLNGRLQIADFRERGRFLETFQIVELINRGFDFSKGALESESLVVEYLTELKELCRKEQRLQILSVIHSYLMKYQPFNLKHVSERAMVAYETGDYRMAIDDIRNYFQYKQPEFTNKQLKRVYKMALRLERLSTNKKQF